ncbi:hypothetical protein ISCGN_014074 [Ixodes scapularis]
MERGWRSHHRGRRSHISHHGHQGRGTHSRWRPRSPRPQGQGPGPSRRDQGNADFHILCRRCRRRPQATVTTWMVQTDGGPVGWASRQAWEEQPRPERGEAHVIVPEPFRGRTLEDRHPNDPAAQYTAEERRLLCPLCGVPELARETHRAGLLHVTREAADRAARLQNHDELQRAIDVVRRQRPQLLRSNDHDEHVIDMPDF